MQPYCMRIVMLSDAGRTTFFCSAVACVLLLFVLVGTVVMQTRSHDLASKEYAFQFTQFLPCVATGVW